MWPPYLNVSFASSLPHLLWKISPTLQISLHLAREGDALNERHSITRRLCAGFERFEGEANIVRTLALLCFCSANSRQSCLCRIQDSLVRPLMPPLLPIEISPA
ncbi:hypothetical protein ARMGADRAFT_96266 [Armillaria gallica]|uniref:Uncharacterized protein n=1 Tax=Armillaria gallica TaxID=47427 RepID=A0A2H3CV69_ARMGA|nr:hypothetical protein ARMGADRAFT_96266 [Armillaria gallica]